MRGDRLLIEAHHRQAAARIQQEIEATRRDLHPAPLVVSIGGESGSGKSELGQALADRFQSVGRTVILLQQDDYFLLPPRTNDQRRRQELEWVGMGEVRLELLDRHLVALRGGATHLTKPLVDYDADEITEESIRAEGIDIVIVEGTYTTALDNVDRRVFIDRTYRQTAEARRRRARDAQDAFVERVLEIEHEIIASQMERADIVVTSDYRVVTPPRDQIKE